MVFSGVHLKPMLSTTFSGQCLVPSTFVYGTRFIILCLLQTGDCATNSRVLAKLNPYSCSESKTPGGSRGKDWVNAPYLVVPFTSRQSKGNFY